MSVTKKEIDEFSGLVSKLNQLIAVFSKNKIECTMGLTQQVGDCPPELQFTLNFPDLSKDAIEAGHQGSNSLINPGGEPHTA